LFCFVVYSGLQVSRPRIQGEAKVPVAEHWVGVSSHRSIDLALFAWLVAGLSMQAGQINIGLYLSDEDQPSVPGLEWRVGMALCLIDSPRRKHSSLECHNYELCAAPAPGSSLHIYVFAPDGNRNCRIGDARTAESGSY
jgi:hypothetical protein